MTPRSTFVTYSSKDSYFVSLLLALLDYHGVRPWSSTRNVAIGSRSESGSGDGLDQADSVLVVVSKNSAASRWVRKDLTAFMASKPQAHVIPVLLDNTNPTPLLDGISAFQRIDFATDMREGFVSLLDYFGTPFLPRQGNHATKRRGAFDRRTPEERRISSLRQRLRIGFWKGFQRQTRKGEFDELSLDLRSLLRLETTLREEAARYTYSRKSNEAERVTSEAALHAAVDAVRIDWSSRSSIRAVYLIEAIAETLAGLFDVRVLDRRTTAGRRELVARRDVLRNRE